MIDLLFSYKGRIGRGSWWLAQLSIVAIVVAVLVLAFSLRDDFGNLQSDTTSVYVGFVAIAAFPLMVWINIVSSIKRFHDRGKIGYWALIMFVPYIGGIWQIVECGFLAGQTQDNEYGPALDAHKPVSKNVQPAPMQETPVKAKQRPFEYDLRPRVKTGRTRKYHPTSPGK